MKVLITGGNGLIGTELRKYLPTASYIDRDQEIPKGKYDYIIHTAANSVVRETIKNPVLAKENIDVTFDIMEKARKDNSKIIIFSSARVTGEENPYVTSKKFGESLTLSYKNCYNLESIVIRPETVWSRGEKTRRVINTWIDAVSNNQPCIVYGNREKELPPIHVEEFAKIFFVVFSRFNDFVYKTISISGQPRKVTELIDCIGDYCGKVPLIKFKKPELTQPQNYNGSDIIGKIPFEEQLKL